MEARESVSDILLRAREEYGQDLRSVSDSLRIRYIYLLAIEEGRFEDLPGATYAVGFVRTYADYLGLDSEDIVRRFKAEVEGLERRTQLVFPVPKPEGKLPGGAIIMISLLLVGIAYGGWYFLSQSDQTFVEMISGEEAAPVTETAATSEPAAEGATDTAAAPDPTRDDTTTQAGAGQETSSQQGANDGAPATGTAQLQTGQGDGNVETLPPDPPVETEALPPPGEGEQAAATDNTLPEAPEQGSQATGVARPEQQLQQEIPEAAAAEPAAQPENTTDATDATDTSDQAAATGTTTDPAGGEENASAIPAAPRSDQLASAPAGRVFGEEEGSVRIVVRAKQDAWVQVRDSQNQLLLTEVLRSGDVYRVPDLDGLTMLTGNAGGLEITVDGEVAPTLGPIGVVRRNVALDPQRLSAGTAVGQQNVE